MKLILGTKKSMTQIFDSNGKVQPVTEVFIAPNRITYVKTKEKDGYDALQLGCGEKKHGSKALRGHIRGVAPAREGSTYKYLKEVRTDVVGIERGSVIDVSSFAVGDIVDAIGWSKGRGYTGVVKRHGFHGQKSSHGHKDQERMPGSIGAGGVQHVFKGKRMAGRMGNERVTAKNLEIVRIDLEKNTIFVKGAVPGWYSGLVMLRSQGDLKIQKAVQPSTQEEQKDPTASDEKKPEEAVIADTAVEMPQEY